MYKKVVKSINMEKNFFEQYREKCEKCNYGRKVVIPANDPANGYPGNKIDILFIGERPGPKALGTDLISFDNPDGSAGRGKRFFTKIFGLKYRTKIFITNAVLWCPKEKKYRNTNPTLQQIKCGSDILLDQIKKIKPKIIVVSGKSALNALYFCLNDDALNCARKMNLRDIAGTLITKTPYKVIPLFHTSSRNLINRSEIEQLKDWEKMKKLIKIK